MQATSPAGAFKALQITDRVFWVGAIDWNVRDFHGYSTPRGTSYNAYLVLGEKVTLIDTVKRPFFSEMMARISSVIEPSRIDTVISLHAEMDHSGSLPELIAAVKPARLLTSKAGIAALKDHFALDVPVEAVANGATVDVGGASFTFNEVRMLHWPESMVAFLNGDGVFFSQDMFGMHVASHERFADEVPADIVEHESAKYFANIIMPYSDMVTRQLSRVAELMPATKVIATDHGPIWRKDFDTVLRRYATWARRPPSRELVVAYDTMWESTGSMARAIAEGAHEAGVSARVMRLNQTHRSDVATALLTAGGFAVGSPVLNAQMFPTVADLLTYIRGLKPRSLVAGVFGSYGWSPAPFEEIATILRDAKMEIAAEPLLVKYVPKAEDLQRCREMGAAMAARILAAVQSQS